MNNADLNASKIAVKNKISVDLNHNVSFANCQNLYANVYSIKLKMDNMLIPIKIQMSWKVLKKLMKILNMEVSLFLIARFALNYLNIVHAHLKNSDNHNANSAIN